MTYTSKMTKRDTSFINSIIYHYSQTPIGREVSVEEIREWHIKRGMADIAYHYLVHLDGTVSIGRDLNFAGAHARGHNLKSIGICYVGGTIKGGVDTRTEAQKMSLINLTMSLITVFPNITSLYGHNDVSQKLCPAFNPSEEYGYMLTNRDYVENC